MIFNDPSKILIKTCLTFCSDVEAIFTPLFQQLGVHGFSFHRIYENEDRIFMCNSDKWIENYFSNNYFATQIYKNYFTFPPYILWREWPKTDDRSLKIIQDAHNNFNYGNSLAVIRLHKGYVDIFCFRGYANDSDVNNRYLMHLNNINMYCDYFLIKFKKLIVRAEENKIIMYPTQDDLINNSGRMAGSNKFHQFCILHPETGESFLGKREIECLQGLIQGKTAKEIARSLNISFRTVEQYLNNTKDKMDVRSKSALLDKILSVDHNKKILIGLI